MRPVSIVWFERLYALAILTGAIQALAVVHEIIDEARWTGTRAAAAYAMIAVGLAIPTVLLWLVARRASDVARWLIVLLVAMAVAVLALRIASGRMAWGVFDLASLVQHALAVAAVAMTFRPDARAWLVKPRAEA